MMENKELQLEKTKKIDQMNLQIKALTIKFQTLFENQLAKREINVNLKGILATPRTVGVNNSHESIKS